mmetsp:Transcript_12320/g.18908  ORF Transcript_12320/g.18908 Transcript_12320/m.18908 type:complete len:603 (+) Transcript_12320:101-1909(+)
MNLSEKCKRNKRYASSSDHDYDSSSEDRFSQATDNPKRSTASTLTINSAIAQENSVSDIVVVVLAAASRQEAPTTKKIASKTLKYNILIGDSTLPHGKCARMAVSITSRSLNSLLGVDGKEGTVMMTPMKNVTNDGSEHAFDLGMLQPGDIVRFNNVEIHKRYENEYTSISSPGKRKQEFMSNNNENNQTTQLLKSIVCDLRTSYKVPCAGPPVARICRIIPESATLESSEHHLQWEQNIPRSFETSRDVVEDLARYYCRCARPRDLSNTLVLPTTQACQRRRIRDINTDNIVSHVLVKVLRCERAKSLFTTPTKSPTEPRITHATLADGQGNDDMIGIAASVRFERVAGTTPLLPKGISTTLLQAMALGKFVLITNVTSQSLNPVAVGKEYLRLVPTVDTTATIITPEHPYYVKSEMSQRRNIDSYASQPLTLERASQLLSLTQHDSQEKRDARCLMAIEAPLIDIFVDGVSASLVEGACWENPRALSNFLIHRPSISTGLDAIKLQPSYRSATFLLDPKFVSREIVVNADGNALKLLCMDVPIEDMIIEDNCIDASTHPYLLHVGQLLKSLCEEDVRIRWVLEQEDECNWFATNASLLEI